MIWGRGAIKLSKGSFRAALCRKNDKSVNRHPRAWITHAGPKDRCAPDTVP
jgi:hypothetical protein